MELNLNTPGNQPHVRHVDAESITVFDRQMRVLRQSFVMTRTNIVEHWPVAHAGQLDLSSLQVILEQEPEVVVLGTGTRQVFPPAQVRAAFLQRGIGVEVMDNHAAARTHTILIGEDRHVVAAFMLPGELSGAADT